MGSLFDRRVISGLLLLDKPKGPTSHDAVLWARRVLNTADVGHCGSLDPMATGLILLVVGETRSKQNQFMAERKTYRGVIRLGLATTTDDLDGAPLPGSFPRKPADLSAAEIEKALGSFRGPVSQEVPTYSAVKWKGKPLYHWARKGVPVERPVKEVVVHFLEMTGYTPPDVEFFVDCSKGFYVRSLARDLGAVLGVGGTLAALTRETIGNFKRTDAYPWEDRSELNKDIFDRSFIPIEKLPD
ncbi:MAG: tRNA pseudouridine(55) synthase TruB [Elusimicrobia bacterium]|nr:tRNA pseudouridine(55) synthase TruB [Elusimicrobiota bacterium]